MSAFVHAGAEPCDQRKQCFPKRREAVRAKKNNNSDNENKHAAPF